MTEVHYWARVGWMSLMTLRFVLFVGVLSFAMGCSASDPSDTSVFRTVSAEELARAYTTDPTGADAAYRGQDLSVTGTIHSVTQLYPNSAMVLLRGDGNHNVGCFPGRWGNYRDLSGPVTMFGVGLGLNFTMRAVEGVIDLSHCEVVRPGEPTPVGRPSPKPTP